jgi:carbamoyl-phosphate synthase large subunit
VTSVNVTVSGAGSLFGQGIVKALRMEGSALDLSIAGLDYFDTAIGFRWCDNWAILPDYLSDKVSEDEWFDNLCKQIKLSKSQYLFVGADFELLPIAKRAEELKDRTGCTAIVSPKAVVNICKDKFETARVMQSSGLSAPLSFLPEEADKAVDLLGFPMLVKPRFGARSRGVVVVRCLTELTKALADSELPVIQEYLPEDDQEYSCGVVWLDEKIDSVCVLRRRLRDGNTSVAYSEPAPEVESYCVEIAKALKPFGPLNVQLRLKNGKPYVFEINPRFSGTTVFRAHFGINEPQRILSRLCGLDVPSLPVAKNGRIIRYFDEIVELTPNNREFQD